MPPLERSKPTSRCSAAIEDTARAHAPCRSSIEGYAPPRDPRVRVLSVTPDPGVIEVNVHPASSWRELIDDDARRCTRKRGRRGSPPRSSCSTAAIPAPAAATTSRSAARRPADSPLLRRPGSAAKPDHLLAEPSGAVVSVFRHVRRPDEPGAARRRSARRSAVRAGDRVPAARRASTQPGKEIDATLARRPAAAASADRPDRQHAPRRILDRQAVFARHADGAPRPARVPRVRDAAALPDERRADAAAARAGRALLARAVSRRADPLGHGAARPLAAAAFRRGRHARRRRRARARSATRSQPSGSIRSSSFAFRASAPSTYDGVTLELRQAIEPWHVLGEEIGGTGTARYVDSSVERLQIKVTGMTDEPACGDVQRARVAADRRPACRANSSPACAFAPGARRRRCIRRSACRRRCASTSSTAGRSARSAAARITSLHPGGRNYDTFPVNANEAEARRVARFWAHGHTPGPRDSRSRETAQSRDADDARPALAAEPASRSTVRMSLRVRTRFAPSPTGFPASRQHPLRAVPVGVRAPASAARSSCGSRTPTSSVPRRKRCRRSSTRWRGSDSTTTRGRSTRCSGWIGIARCSTTCSRADSRIAATRPPPSSTRCAPSRWRAAKSRATTGAGAPRMRQDTTPPPGVAPVYRFRNPDRRAPSHGTDAVKGRDRDRQRRARRPGHRARRRHAHLQLLRRRRRSRHADHARDPRRRSRQQHAAPDQHHARAGRDAARVCAPADGADARGREALQASWRARHPPIPR